MIVSDLCFLKKLSSIWRAWWREEVHRPAFNRTPRHACDLRGIYYSPTDMWVIWTTPGLCLFLCIKFRGEWKAGSKLNIQKTKIMASGPIASWQIDGETMETVTHFIFLGSKITADGACSHKIKTLALWKKSYAPPRQHIQKQRH